MYFLAKNLRSCSRPLRGTLGSVHLYKNGVLDLDYLAKNMSFFMMHPEQLKQKLKERDAHMLCQFFDSEDYKQRVTAFLETQSRILIKDSVTGVKKVKYQHVLSCAQPSHRKPKSPVDMPAKMDVKVNVSKSKKTKKGTIIDHIMQKKSEMEAIKEEADIQAAKKELQTKKVRHRTTIMPIFLKKMKKKYVRMADMTHDDEPKAPGLHLQTARRLPTPAGDPEPLYAQILHRSNIYHKGLKTLDQERNRVIPKPQRSNFDTNLTPNGFSEKPHTLTFKSNIFNVNNPLDVSEFMEEKGPDPPQNCEKSEIEHSPFALDNAPSEPLESEHNSSTISSNASSKLDHVPYKPSKANSKYDDISLKLNSPSSVGHIPLRMSSSTAKAYQKGVTTQLCPKKNANMNRKSFSELLSVEPLKLTRLKKTKKVPYDLDKSIQIEELNKIDLKMKDEKKGEGEGNRKGNTLQVLMEKVYKSRSLDLEDNLERKNTIVAVLRNRGAQRKKKTAQLEMPSLFEKVKMGSSKNKPQTGIKTSQEIKPKIFETKTTLKPIILNSPKKEIKEPKIINPEQQSCTYKIVAKNREKLGDRLKKKFNLNPPFWKNTFSIHFENPTENPSKNKANDTETGSTKTSDFLNFEEQRRKLGIVSKNIPNNLHRPVHLFVEHASKPKMVRLDLNCGKKIKAIF